MKVQHAVTLAPYTTLRVGGPAETLITLDDPRELLTASNHAEGRLWLLGYGANCLISDAGLPGTVIANRCGVISVSGDRQLTADSGVAWDELVTASMKHGWYGLELTSGIPGGVGAAVVGNIAAYGQQVADRFVSARVLNNVTGKITTWRKDDCRFDYRSSAFHQKINQHQVIIDVTFSFTDRPQKLAYDSALRVAAELGLQPDSLEHRRAIIMETRRRAGSLLDSDPNSADHHWSAGSFFKNPLVNAEQVEAIIAYEETGLTKEQLLRQNSLHGGQTVRVSAAHVLLAAGFERGQEWGPVRLHPQHILKIENTGQATAQQIYDVVQEIISTVKQKLNINLEPEVRFLGDFKN